MSTNSRFPLSTGANPYFKKDNTFRVLTGDFQNPAYAASVALVINASKTIVQILPLTGPLSLSINVGTGTADAAAPFLGDRIEFILASDGTTRTVTWGAGFTPTAATLVVTTAKFATAQFVFNGTTWLQEGSAVTA